MRIAIACTAAALALAGCASEPSPSASATATGSPSPIAAPNPTTVIVDPDAPEYCAVAVSLPALEDAVAAAHTALLAAMSDTDTLVAGDLSALTAAGTATLAALSDLSTAVANARALADDDEAEQALTDYLAGIEDRYRPVAEVAAGATDLETYLADVDPAIDSVGDLPSTERGVIDGFFAETRAISAE